MIREFNVIEIRCDVAGCKAVERHYDSYAVAAHVQYVQCARGWHIGPSNRVLCPIHKQRRGWGSLIEGSVCEGAD